jgi:ABC-2 type transport system permease protein
MKRINWNRIRLIIAREYITRVRTRSFLLGTFLSPIGIILFMFAFVWVTVQTKTETKVLVVDEGGVVIERLHDKDALYFTKSTLDFESSKKIYVEEGYDALLYIPKGDLINPRGIKLIGEHVLGKQEKDRVSYALDKAFELARLGVLHIEPEVYESISKSVTIEVLSGENEQSHFGRTEVAYGVGYLSAMMMYILLLTYGMRIMNSVNYEKSGRVVEVMLSVVEPFELLLGKIVAIGALSLTQFGAWIFMGSWAEVGISLWAQSRLKGLSTMPGVRGGMATSAVDASASNIAQLSGALQDIHIGQIMLMVGVYLVLGYLFYAALFAALGALNNDNEGGGIPSFVVTMPLLVSFYISFQSSASPNGAISMWGSLIPFSSPIIMPTRLAFDPPWWQLVLSIVFLLIGIVGAIWVAAKIYRAGILMSGKRFTLKEIVRVFRQS